MLFWQYFLFRCAIAFQSLQVAGSSYAGLAALVHSSEGGIMQILADALIPMVGRCWCWCASGLQVRKKVPWKCNFRIFFGFLLWRVFLYGFPLERNTWIHQCGIAMVPNYDHLKRSSVVAIAEVLCRQSLRSRAGQVSSLKDIRTGSIHQSGINLTVSQFALQQCMEHLI